MRTEKTGKVFRFTPTLCATGATVCFSYSALALLLLHFLRPDYAPSHRMISDYAVGEYGWVMTTWFLAMSGGLLMLLLGLIRSGPASGAARLGALLLSVASIGLIVSAAFPTDLEGMPSTPTGDIHTISFLVNVASIIFATTLWSASFWGNPRWRNYRRTAVALVVLIWLAFVLQFLTMQRHGAPFGLANRLFVVLIFAWLLATSTRLRTLAGE